MRTLDCAIMQPTYLPWVGYFELIARVRRFVFLDDVQLVRGWQHRNRINMDGREHMLSVSVARRERGQTIADSVLADDTGWRERHCATLRQAYRDAPHPQVVDLVAAHIGDRSITGLAQLNMRLIRELSAFLGLDATWTVASDLAVTGARSTRLVNVLRAVDAGSYYSAAGSRDYMEADGVFATSGIAVTFQDFTPPPYPQRRVAGFISHLSVVDAIAEVGAAGVRRMIDAA